eukprot:832340-Pyramimonas_sp.AAC.1
MLYTLKTKVCGARARAPCLKTVCPPYLKLLQDSQASGSEPVRRPQANRPVRPTSTSGGATGRSCS